MLSDSVAQKPTLAVSAGKKNGQNWPAFGPPGRKLRTACASIGPNPPAA